MDSGGDGGLGLDIEMKQFILLNREFEFIEHAEEAAESVKERIPNAETVIAITAGGHYVVWYRN